MYNRANSRACLQVQIQTYNMYNVRGNKFSRYRSLMIAVVTDNSPTRSLLSISEQSASRCVNHISYNLYRE